MDQVSVVFNWLELAKQHQLTLSLVFTSSLFLLLVFLKPKKNLPPSPPKLPIIGNLHQLTPLLHHCLRDLSKKYGPLMMLNFGTKPTLVVSSAEIAREIMKTQDIAFANRPVTTTAKLLFYDCTDMGFAPYGDYWRQIRKISTTEVLSMKRVVSFNYIRKEEVAIMIEKISRCASTGTPANLSNLIVSLSNDIICRCALGRKLEPKDDNDKFGVVIKQAVAYLGTSSFEDFFPWLAWVDVVNGLIGKVKKVSKEMDNFFEQIIAEHVENTQHDDDKKDFVDVLLQVQKNGKLDIQFTKDNIKALILDMFLGGTETLSSTVVWAITELMRKPVLMKKTQEEVRRVIGEKQEVDGEDIHQMEYMKLVVKETLRLHPPGVFLVPRESAVDTEVNGYHIPSKTRVMINAWAIHRDSIMWEKSEEFIPERFENTSYDFNGKNHEYIPFGSGRRICPGISFGVVALEFLVANLLCWFDWELPADVKELDMDEEFGMSVYKKIPLCLIPKVYRSPSVVN